MLTSSTLVARNQGYPGFVEHGSFLDECSAMMIDNAQTDGWWLGSVQSQVVVIRDVAQKQQST
ncbi:MAG: hypothetical protein ACKVH8_03360 [Pirellulales bacterium]